MLMVSLYNRLGGHVMRWSNLRGQQWGGTTLPVSHDGNFYNSEIKVNDFIQLSEKSVEIAHEPRSCFASSKCRNPE